LRNLARMNDTKDLAGKTFLVTGANTGIGKATVEALAARGATRILIAARSADKTQPVLDAAKAQGVETAFVAMDLADLASVKRAADEVLAKDWTIDTLVNNAGIAGLQGLTKDGFEITFGTNHLGPYLFTEKLLPLVKRARQGRIVNVSSEGHYRHKAFAPGQTFDWEAVRKPTAHTTGLPEYFMSKLCNVLHAKELARRLEGTNVTTYSLHPGGVASDIWERRSKLLAFLIKPFLITNEKGARTQVRCATDPALARETGLYYDKERVKEPSQLAHDVRTQDELKRKSDEWVAKFVA
jgi:NAD(P)-dependent dehydrogenase (short-subunit alcohol dehydrogenase family)